MMEIATEDSKTDHSALKTADEVLGYCAASISDFRRREILPLIKEAQKRIRQRTNPEMFDETGNYK